MRTIRVFVSSPSDVREERRIAQAIVKKLELRFHAQARFEPTFWETELYDARGSIQAKLPRPGTFDIVVVILWSTMGTACFVDPETGQEHASGTCFEIADAVRGHQGRQPTLLVCQCARPFSISADSDLRSIHDAKQRWDAVQEFFARGIQALGVQTVNRFEQAADFAIVLEKTLVERVKELLAGAPETNGAAARDSEPYKGLRVFDAEDHGFFFGRARAVLRVVDALRRQDRAGRPFLLVFGRSGVGKSSFVRAGVVPHVVHAGVVDGVDCWRTAIFEPSDSTSDLLGGLAAAICGAGALPELAEDTASAEAVAATLRSNPQGLVPVLKATLARVGAGRGARLLLVVDPFEEVFTRRSKDEEVAQFARALRTLCESRLVWVVGTVRVDFYARCTAIEDIRLLEENDGHYNLPPLNYTELREIVLEPADRAGIRFERAADGTSLADELVNASFGQSDPLPLLAYALQQLHERSNAATTGVLTFAALAELGHIAGLLTKRADEARNAAFRRMQGDPEATSNRVFARLVSVDREGRRVRLYARPESFDDGDSRILLEELDRARLLITDKDDQGRIVISIAHETMLREWQSLSSWIEHRETMLRLTRTLGEAAEEWLRNDRAPAYLILQDTRLATAEQFVRNPAGLPVPAEVKEFVQAHVDRRDADQRRRRVQTRRFVTVLASATFVAMVMAGVAVWQMGVSNAESTRAERNAQDSQELVDFMLEDLKQKLDHERDRPLIDAIADRLVQYYRERHEDDVGTVHSMYKTAQALKQLNKWDGAIEIAERAVRTERERGSPASPELVAMHESLATWMHQRNRVDDAVKHYDQAIEAAKLQKPVDRAWLAKLTAARLGMSKIEGRYIRAIQSFRTARKELEDLGDEGLRHLPPVYDGLAENLRYAGHVQEAKEVYDHFDATWRSKGLRMDPAFEIEHGILRGLVGECDAAISGMQKTIEDFALTTEDVQLAQFRYKLARVLTACGRLVEAEEQLRLSHATMNVKEFDKPKLAKCLEAYARLRLKQNRAKDALEFAKEVVRIREKVFSKEKRIQRDFIDAYSLLADCCDATDDRAGATKARGDAERIRKELLIRETAEARALGVDLVPNFDPPPSR